MVSTLDEKLTKLSIKELMEKEIIIEVPLGADYGIISIEPRNEVTVYAISSAYGKIPVRIKNLEKEISIKIEKIPEKVKKAYVIYSNLKDVTVPKDAEELKKLQHFKEYKRFIKEEHFGERTYKITVGKERLHKNGDDVVAIILENDEGKLEYLLSIRVPMFKERDYLSIWY